MDFDLTKPDSEGNVIGISGVSLSTELRQKFPDVPIVLFTRKSVFKIENYSEIRETLSSIDNIIFVRNGSVGNRTLGAIDYLNKYTTARVRIINADKFRKL